MRAFFCLFVVALSSAWYLPGVAPRDFEVGDPIELKVNNLDSVVTQLPYDYYSVAYCKPKDVVEVSEGLGEIMSGERMQNSPYELFMNKNEMCKELCKVELSVEQLKLFEQRITEQYSVNWVVDNIPSATVLEVITENEDGTSEPPGVTALKGFAMGYVEQGTAYLHNHIQILLSYHLSEDTGGYRVVGFEVLPLSVEFKDQKCDRKTVQQSSTRLAISGLTGPKSVLFSYDVVWEASTIKWASRWDVYLKSINTEVHWFSILNSTSLVLILSGILATTLIRALKKDLSRYNALAELGDDDDGGEEAMGWKQVHGDVFRAPSYAHVLPVLLGTGAQILAMTVITLVFACFGLLSPSNRGALMTAFLILFVLMGVPAGFVGARMHKMLGLQDWKRNAFRISFVFPGVVFSIFFVVNLFIWQQRSTAAVPFGTLLALLALWLGISFPLTMMGAYVGNRKATIEYPVRVNHLARAIPEEQPWFITYGVFSLAAGFLPFGCVFMEMFFIMTSVWEHQFYYMFGVLGLVFIVLVIISAEVSIFVVYMVLTQENYHWWWRGVFASGSSAIYLLLYSVYYFLTQMQIIKFVSALVFFGYMLIAACAFFIATGTIGFVASLWFVRKIYATIKID